MDYKKTVLVTPLFWGIGHASRCIPIITELLNNNYKVIIASDGKALEFLKLEFNELIFEELPSYNIEYSNSRLLLKIKLIAQFPRLQRVISEEFKKTQQLIDKHNIDIIISDNRFGVRSKQIKSIFITHQINIKSGITSFIASFININYLKKFDEVWIPDDENINLSGELSNTKSGLSCKYLGILSRFNYKNTKIENNYLILLSGPEPQRTNLEKILINEFKKTEKTVILVQGKIDTEQKIHQDKNLTIYNFMLSDELENCILKSEIIISRSGYSTILDLAKLNKKAFFIPTPGQSEQEYLAPYLQKMKVIPFCKQSDFTISHLDRLKNFTGFNIQVNNQLSKIIAEL